MRFFPTLRGSASFGAEPSSAPLRAALAMLGAMACFSLIGPLVKAAAETGLHVLQIVFFRLAFAAPLLAPGVLRQSGGLFRSRQPGLLGVRALVSALAMSSGFAAAALIPLADATAIGFAAPLFATLCAVAILGERIRLRRVVALGVGFVGVVIVLQPGASTVAWGALLGLFSAALVGLSAVIVKRLSATETPEAIAFWMVALQTPLALIPAVVVWRDPSWAALAAGLGLAVAGSVGHVLWSRAIALGEVTQLQPIEFVKLPMVALIAFAAFGQTPTAAAWIGGAVIVGATAYIAARESRLARAGRL